MKKEWIITSVTFVVIVACWIGSWIYVDLNVVWNNRGVFGDKFGFVNSLFSGLALGGIIISIRLQQKELKDTRKEFKDQNFQTTFFNLLKTQREIANEISAEVWNLQSYDKHKRIDLKGRAFFNQSKSELRRIISALESEKYLKYFSWNESNDSLPTNEYEAEDLTNSYKEAYTFKYYNLSSEIWEDAAKHNSIQRARLSYGIFFNKFHFVIGHYFRHLYHIFNFLEQQEVEMKKAGKKSDIKEIEKEFKVYANFVQAQMTTPELFLSFYNSLSFPRFQRLLVKYNVLENLTVEDLLDKKHNCIQGINLKSRNELVK